MSRTDPNPLFRRAAVVGIGSTDYTKRSGRTEWALAVEAITHALADAGIDHGDVDGVIRYASDSTNEAMLAETFGWSLRYHSQVGFGGQSAAAVLGHAAAAIAGGLARVVVCYRSLNGRSSTRYGRAERRLGDGGAGPELVPASGRMAPQGAFTAPYGLLAPAQVMALWASRYAAESGIDRDTLSAALGRIAVDQRAYANANPDAFFHDQPLDAVAYSGAPWIAEPLRLYDLCLETDGAAAVVVAAPDVVAAVERPPAWILASQQALREESMELYSEPVNGAQHRADAARLFHDAGVAVDDFAVVQLYDASTIMVLLSLECYGLVPPASAWRHVIDEGIGPSAGLGVNTSGGHLSEGYVHGFNHLLEAVRQLRGTSSNQRADVDVTLVGAAGASGVVLGR